MDGSTDTEGATECVGDVTGGARFSASWEPLPIVLSLGSALVEGTREADGVTDRVGDVTGEARSSSTIPVLPLMTSLG